MKLYNKDKKNSNMVKNNVNFYVNILFVKTIQCLRSLKMSWVFLKRVLLKSTGFTKMDGFF